MAARFFLLRHGQSQANVQGLIVSARANAYDAHGLTEAGREQVRRTVSAALADRVLPASSSIVSSPLLRARESAAVAAELLGTQMRVDERLIERGFGTLELGPDDAYEAVWAEDRVDPEHDRWGVESAKAVLARARAAMRDLANSAEAIVLCTHGDVASVLYCASLGLPLGRHREVGALSNAEIRELAGP